jgi:hypothetical protein
MPPPGPNGGVIPSAVPDFVAVAGPDGIAGYVEKAAVLDPGDRTWPVYGPDLVTVTGQMVPGRGFVPVGVDPAAVPTIEVLVGSSPNPNAGPPVVTAFVRNAGSNETWIAVVVNRVVQPGGGGFDGNGYVGVWCDPVPAGASLVVLDRSAVELGAQPRQLIYTATAGDDTVSRWIDVAKDGGITIGSGVPSWWVGGPPPC